MPGKMIDLTDRQLERYARHVILDEVGEEGQLRLLRSRVLVIGAGGLGAPLLLYMAAAGVGTVGVIDDDRVDLSNLQRQIVHRTADAGVKMGTIGGDAPRPAAFDRHRGTPYPAAG